MPHKLIRYPRWIDDIDDDCLRNICIEALVARQFAIDHGAENDETCVRVLNSADKTIDNIYYDRVTGAQACKKASDALRKYTVVAECVSSSTKKRRRKS